MNDRSIIDLAFEYDFAVVGLGYVGLPLVEAALDSGLKVIGFDVDVNKVDKLLIDSSNNLNHSAKNRGEVLWTSDPKCLSAASAISICVPTPIDKNNYPDLSYLESAALTVGRQLLPGQLIVLESTTFPGTTEGFLKSILEEQSGLNASKDFFLAYSPERIDPGNKKFNVVNTPKLVGGLTDLETDLACKLYSKFIDKVVKAKGAKEAEAAKLLENIYRHVNIALINEFAIGCQSLGIDVFDVIELAATKPFGFSQFTPSGGAGGHCIPVDPSYFNYAVTKATGKTFKSVDLANKINSTMADYFVNRIKTSCELRNIKFVKSSVLVMGLTYKQDIADTRESPAIGLVQQLVDSGCRVYGHDPHLGKVENWNGITTISDAELHSTLGDFDSVLILQPHRNYLEMIDFLTQHVSKIISPINPSIIPSSSGFHSL